MLVSSSLDCRTSQLSVCVICQANHVIEIRRTSTLPPHLHRIRDRQSNDTGIDRIARSNREYRREEDDAITDQFQPQRQPSTSYKNQIDYCITIVRNVPVRNDIGEVGHLVEVNFCFVLVNKILLQSVSTNR